MAIASNFPAIRPSLDLNFAAGNFDPRITFSRASAATYYDGKTAAKAEENLLTYSTIITGLGWDAAAVSSTANAAVAPDGSMTAGKHVASASAGYHNITRGGLIFSLSNDFVFSFYAKAAEYSLVHAADPGNGSFAAYFDLTAVTATATYGTNRSAGITDVGNGWYRCWIKFTGGGVSPSGISLIGYPVGATLNPFGAQYVGDGTSGIYLWGAQLEQRSQVTAYTPTTTQPITNYIPVLQTAPANVPRIDHDPVTGECKGLLIEEQRTNLLTYSFNPFDVIAGVIAKENSGIVAPTNDIYQRLIELSGNSSGKALFNKNFNTEASSYTLSFYVKNYSGSRFIVLRENTTTGFSFYFSPSKGTFSSFSGAANSTNCIAIPQSDGGYRVCCTIAFASSANRNFTLQMAEIDGGTTIYIGNGVSGFFATSMQLEAGSFPTSYIKTEASQVTRAADSAQMAGANFSSWYRQDEGSLLSEFISSRVGAFQVAGNVSGFGLDVGVSSDDNGFHYNNSTNLITNSVKYVRGAVGKLAFSGGSNNRSVVLNGGVIASSQSPLIIGNTQQGLKIGSTAAGTLNINGCIKKIAYYPKRLTDAQLQALTA